MQTFFFTPQEGRFNFEDPQGFKTLPADLPGKRHVIIVKQHRKTRSINQNAYYWGVVLKIIGDETGYLPEEAHQIFGEKYLKYEKAHREFIRSTTALNTLEMEEYLEKIRRFAAMELHIRVPDPNEVIE